MTILWGIDLGGTKIEGAVFDQRSPQTPLARIRHETQSERGYDHIIARIIELVAKLKTESGENPSEIGFSTPGTLDPVTGTMKNCNTVCLNQRALDKDLAAALGISVHIQNDANCFALTEASFGAGVDQDVVFGVIMGTGVGGGIIVNKKAIGGAQGIAGEWGHNVLIPNGTPCYCGRKGCVENYLAGPRIEDYYEKLAGVRRPLSEIAAITAHDENAAETVEHLTTVFAQSISYVINVLDPSIIVLGGGVSNVPQLYNERTRKKIAEHIFNPRFDTPLVKNKLGDSAGVFGAGFLCMP